MLLFFLNFREVKKQIFTQMIAIHLVAAAVVGTDSFRGVLPSFEWPDGVSFSGVFRDHAVLQRAPQAAALYGVVKDNAGKSLRSDTLAVQVVMTHTAGHAPPVTTDAVHVEVINSTYARWKAVLPPQLGGVDSFSFEATCTGCESAGERLPSPYSTLDDVVFGDVYVCSGKYNVRFSQL